MKRVRFESKSSITGVRRMLRIGIPTFQNQEIEALYQYEFDLPDGVLKSIRALPSECVLSDLEAVLRDSIERGPLYLEDKIACTSRETCFPLHALLILGDIEGAERLLSLVLEVFTMRHGGKPAAGGQGG